VEKKTEDEETWSPPGKMNGQTIFLLGRSEACHLLDRIDEISHAAVFLLPAKIRSFANSRSIRTINTHPRLIVGTLDHLLKEIFCK